MAYEKLTMTLVSCQTRLREARECKKNAELALCTFEPALNTKSRKLLQGNGSLCGGVLYCQCYRKESKMHGDGNRRGYIPEITTKQSADTDAGMMPVFH